ncbi:MAG: small ribosomal subunit biogenesis GTPase RsgA [Sinobacterium sp.]|nr:small ribosomal subunit biogenesis GTPase RsgA [Sinobacterium sp.]
MAKRKLNQQQQKRIKDRQDARIHNAGSHGKKSDKWKDGDLGPELRSIVVARYSRNVDVLSLEGEQEGQVIKCHIRANIDSITVGDKAIWRSTPEGRGVVVAIEPRTSEIIRPDGLGKLKSAAANIDQVFIVIATEPEAHPTLIDRYLLACEHAGIEAAIVLNKCDLHVSDELVVLLETYTKLGYPTFNISAKDETGFDTLRDLLKDKTSIFAGQSGVGKSSMINALLPDADVKTGVLSEHVVKGRHTTTTSILHCLNEGGYIIDSPGIREFHLYHFSHHEIYAGFIELRGLAEQCRFRDCRHIAEPGCAITEFIKDGGLAPTRAHSLNYILNAVEKMR